MKKFLVNMLNNTSRIKINKYAYTKQQVKFKTFLQCFFHDVIAERAKESRFYHAVELRDISIDAKHLKANVIFLLRIQFAIFIT